MNQDQLEGKVILITGGTGSFGNAVTSKILSLNPKKIIIFSRDEKKQFDMGNTYNDERLRFVTGDVRDRDSVMHAMYGVDYVFHAAAMKQVPNCEFFPMEAIRTNCMGAHNVIDAAILQGVKKVVVLSTDKAVHPINVMGTTKSLMEKIMIAASRERRGQTVLCGTRYGNVMYTRGSVIPYFIDLMKKGKPLSVTHKGMTRFMMSLDESIDLVLYALLSGENGDMYVRKSPAASVGDIAEVLVDIFDYQGGISEVGIRPGEKMHETLVSEEESPRTEDFGDYYKISPEVPGMDYKKYFFTGSGTGSLSESYTSYNTKRLTKEELKELILSLPEVQQELKDFQNNGSKIKNS
jgi:UDP-glucose 4-epimerase